MYKQCKTKGMCKARMGASMHVTDSGCSLGAGCASLASAVSGGRSLLGRRHCFAGFLFGCLPPGQVILIAHVDCDGQDRKHRACNLQRRRKLWGSAGALTLDSGTGGAAAGTHCALVGCERQRAHRCGSPGSACAAQRSAAQQQQQQRGI